jgi:hypothetical protein
MAAVSHVDYFESRADRLPTPLVSISGAIARHSIDLKEIAARVRAAVIEVLLLAWALLAGPKTAADCQRVVNPGYNADRHGPVNMVSGRIHIEF